MELSTLQIPRFNPYIDKQTQKRKQPPPSVAEGLSNLFTSSFVPHTCDTLVWGAYKMHSIGGGKQTPNHATQQVSLPCPALVHTAASEVLHEERVGVGLASYREQQVVLAT